jgi:ribose transport system substrate-binding protein
MEERAIMFKRASAAALVAALVAAAAVAGCGSDSEGSSDDATAAATKANDRGPGLAGLPPDIQKLYVKSGQTTQVSPYFHFKAKSPPPWTIAYASSYAGNTWRGDVLKEIKALFATYKQAGLVDKLIVSESNNDVSRHGQQLRQALDKGADGILTIAPSATGVNPAIDAAYRAGVPTVTFTSPVTTVNGINTGVNYYTAGREQAEWGAKTVGANGRVIYLNGIPGYAASEQMKEGSLEVYKEKGIKVVAKPDGIWTQSIGKAALLKTLSTTPGKVDLVHQQSGMAEGALEALQQTGRKSTKVLIADDVAAASYWRDHPDFVDLGFSTFPARNEARVAWEVLLRTLEGQGPRITSILRQPTTFSHDDLARLLPANASAKSTDWIETIPESFYKDTLPKYFRAPADPLTWKPAG